MFVSCKAQVLVSLKYELTFIMEHVMLVYAIYLVNLYVKMKEITADVTFTVHTLK